MRVSLHIRPKQSLGQNFLIDENIVNSIIRHMCPERGDAVVEIGPGRGALTGKLADRAGHLLIVEIDGRIIDQLRAKFSLPHVVVLHRDFLEIDLAEWQREWGSKLRVVGNLPYHMTSPILFKLFEAAGAVRDVTIMVQREVSRRITAAPGTKAYGILSVITRFYGTPKELFTVSPHCFYPRPNVTSAMLHIRLHEEVPSQVSAGLFRTVVRTAFGKRRKTLRNSLSFLPFEEAVVRRIAKGITFPLEKRPEELTLEQFVELVHQIEQIIT